MDLLFSQEERLCLGAGRKKIQLNKSGRAPSAMVRFNGKSEEDGFHKHGSGNPVGMGFPTTRAFFTKSYVSYQINNQQKKP